jgi:hypothetical protein
VISRFLAALAFVFPFARPLTLEQQAFTQRLDDDTKALINSANWEKSPASALEYASRIMDGELERRKSAEGKATTYLAVLAALVPVTLSIEAAEWDHKTGPAPEWVRLMILIVAVIYTGAAGWYAFRALQVAGVHVVGVYDLAQAWQGSNGQQKLAESTAKHIRASHAAINAKVTSIKVTHAHLIRAFLFFIALLLLDPVAYQLQAIGVIPKVEQRCQTAGIGSDRSDPRVPKNCGTAGSTPGPVQVMPPIQAPTDSSSRASKPIPTATPAPTSGPGRPVAVQTLTAWK